LLDATLRIAGYVHPLELGGDRALSHERPRVEPRTKALIKARIRDAGDERDVCILDVSTRGLLATTATPPPRGEFVELMVGRHKLVGHVKWAGDRRFGLVLRERISVAGLVAGDTRSIILARSQSARKRNGSLVEAFADNWRNLGGALQLAVMVAIGAAGAWLLAGYASNGLSSLQDAKLAMTRQKMS